MSRVVYCENDLVRLVEHLPCDDRALYDCWSDPETKRGYNGYTPAASFEAFRQKENTARFSAMIQRNDTGEIIGTVGISPPETEPDLSIRIFAPWRRQGYGSAAFALAAKYATETLGIAELHAGAYPDNVGSRKMLARCDFVPNPAGNVLEKHYLTGEEVTQMDYIYRPVTTVHVPLGERAYDVLIGSGLLAQSGSLIAERLRPRKALVVSDENVRAHGYVDAVLQSMNAAGVVAESLVLPAGEAQKNLAGFERILNACAAFELSGGDVLVALGGGVIGDLTGFAAASYRRGMRYVQVPTTLLAAVDSSVGGKTGLNLAAGKNLAGAFWQPGLVLCDTDTHATLPLEEYANGVAECLKYGILWDEALFGALERGGRVTAEQVARCVALKRDVVVCDEHDTGARQLLNFGHTIGHAIEQVSGYAVAHGAAVGIGMVAESRVFCPEIAGRICVALGNNGLPTVCEYSVEELFAALEQDKKRRGGEITMIAPLRIGECELRSLPMGELREMLEECL